MPLAVGVAAVLVLTLDDAVVVVEFKTVAGNAREIEVSVGIPIVELPIAVVAVPKVFVSMMVKLYVPHPASMLPVP